MSEELREVIVKLKVFAYSDEDAVWYIEDLLSTSGILPDCIVSKEIVDRKSARERTPIPFE